MNFIRKRETRHNIFYSVLGIILCFVLWSNCTTKSFAFVATLSESCDMTPYDFANSVNMEKETMPASEAESLEGNNQEVEHEPDANNNTTENTHEPVSEPQTEPEPESEPETPNHKEDREDVTQQESKPTVTESTTEAAKPANTSAYPVTDLKADAYLSDDEGHYLALQNQGKYQQEAQEMYDLINSYRADNGLSALEKDSYLTIMSFHRATESAYSQWFMIANVNGSTHHIRPNGGYSSSIKYYYGRSSMPYGEIMARKFNTCAEALEGWKNSASHRAMLLTTQFTRVGIGIAQDTNGVYYYFAVFTY